MAFRFWHGKLLVPNALTKTPEDWKQDVLYLTERIRTGTYNDRSRAFEGLYYIFNTKNIADELHKHVEYIFSAFSQSMLKPVDFIEYEKAGLCLCSLAAIMRTKMEPQAIRFVNHMLPVLELGTQSSRNAFFHLAFVSAMCISNEELLINIFSKLTDIFINAIESVDESSEKAIVSIIRSIFVLISFLPSQLIAGPLAERITTCLDYALESNSLKLFEAAVDALPFVQEAIVETEADPNNKIHISSKSFADKYRQIIERGDKKDLVEKLSKAKNSYESFKNGVPVKEEFLILHHNITIEGARRVNIVKAFRKASKYFAEVMENNEFIHEVLGPAIVKEIHQEFYQEFLDERNRIERESETVINPPKKEREQSIDKQRRKKEMTQND